MKSINKDYTHCKCISCTGDCLCDECDLCDECIGLRCGLVNNISEFIDKDYTRIVENKNHEKIELELKCNKEFTADEIGELFKSVGWLEDMDKYKLKNALARSSTIITAYHNNKLVALIRCMHDDFYSGTIDCLIVHKDYWNKGIGSALIKDLVNRLSYIKYIRVSLNDSKNIALYTKCGFNKVEDGSLLQIVH